jgi:eukaryotic-like serine/threonine-protein kinase
MSMETVDAPKRGAFDLTGRALDGRYRLVRRLGSGGMGTVYLAEHVALGVEVAVKVLRADLSADEQHRRRFLREARAASKIKNERVVRITDFGVTGDGVVYFVMEHIEGEDLESLLRREGALGWHRAKPLLIQITEALAAAHAAGIVHRDVKPSNCMVYRDRPGGPESVKVLDFGLAKQYLGGDGSGDLTSTGQFFGTVAYMAPELTQGKRADHRTDLYALGILFHRTLTGAVPFSGETAFQVLTHHVSTEPPRVRAVVPSLSAEVEACVLRALAKSPDDRWQSAEDLLAAMQSIPTSPSDMAPALPLLPRPAEQEITEHVQTDTTSPVVPGTVSATRLGIAIGSVVAGMALIGGVVFFGSWGGGPEESDEVAQTRRESVTPSVDPAAAAEETVPDPIVVIDEPTPPGPSQPEVELPAAEAEPPAPKVEAPSPMTESSKSAASDDAAETRRERAPKTAPAGPAEDRVISAQLGKLVKRQCGGAAGSLRIKSAIGSDGRVLSVTVNGGDTEQQRCAKAAAKRQQFRSGAARVVETDVAL